MSADEATGADYWRARMDAATNRDDFLHAWDKWWEYAIGPLAAQFTVPELPADNSDFKMTTIREGWPRR